MSNVKITIKTLYYKVDGKDTIYKIDEKKHPQLLHFLLKNLEQMIAEYNSENKRTNWSIKPESWEALCQEVKTKDLRVLSIYANSIKRLVTLTKASKNV